MTDTTRDPWRAPGQFAIAVVLLCWSVSARAEHLPLKIYTTADGLPHNEINRIVRDSRGFLWFCTRDGLARFDGYAFTSYGMEQGLPSANVADLLETRDGRYWVATAAGLVQFDPSGVPGPHLARNARPSPMFTVASVPDRDPRLLDVNVLLEDRAGTIWCGTGKGLYRLDQTGGGVALRAVDLGMPSDYPLQAFVSAIVEDRAGTLWVATPSGLYRRWQDGRAARYTERDGLPAPYDHLHDLLLDHQGQLWVATRHGGFFQVAAGSSREAITIPRAFAVRDGLPTPWVFRLFEGSDHRFWVGTNQGLIEFVPDAGDPVRRFRVYTVNHGLSFREVTALSEDASGNLWLGTNTAGVMKLARNGFTTYSTADGVSNVNAIFEDGTGSLCVRGTEVDGSGDTKDAYGRFDGRRFDWFKPASVGSLGWVAEQVTLQSRNGEWWLGTGQGVYRFPPTANFAAIQSLQPLTRYTTMDGLAAVQVFRLFEDSHDDVWVATISAPLGHVPYRGLALWERTTGKWKNLTGLVLKDDLPVAFTEDRGGHVWIGFRTRLVRYAGGRFTPFTEHEGLPPGEIRDLHTDRRGRLWLASSRSGLIRLDDPEREHPTFLSYTTTEGLASSTAEVITEDMYGHIYVGTGRGLDRLDPTTGRIMHFTSADGLAPGAFRAAFRDHTGAIWFGMTGGLSRLVPAPDPPGTAPPILVNGVVVAGSPSRVSAIGEHAIALADFAPGENQLQIDFVGLAFTPGETLRYQYRLEGAGSEWSAPSEQRSVTYANLAPGRYRFQVRAVSANGTASTTPATISFTVLPPIWARWWFVALAIGFVGIAARTVYRARMARIFEVANVRARIAADLHDDIGANLTKIAILSEVARQQPADGSALPDRSLASIASISRESVAAMSDIVWAINPQRDRLDDLVRRMRQHAEEVFTAAGVQLTFRAPGDGVGVKLGPQVRRDVYLIFKEAVNNAARHARCTRVEVDIHVEGSWLSVAIVDDGVGFDARTIHDGQGLTTMRRRAERIGGTFEVLTNASTGTRVHVRLPTTVAPTRDRPTSMRR